jgi:hypothetical protein
MGFLNYAPVRIPSRPGGNVSRLDEFATLPLIDLNLLGKAAAVRFTPVTFGVDSVEVEDLEESN